ncbi:MAG: hypothetical protein ACLTXL_15570 [Clostridia bacterium]
MGHELLERCDELWVMGDTISRNEGRIIGYFSVTPDSYVSDDMVKNQKMIRQSDRPLTSMTASPIVASTTTKINFGSQTWGEQQGQGMATADTHLVCS